jgi:hypothetical protein
LHPVALTGCQGHKVRRPITRSSYGDMRLDRFCVAETDSGRPEYFARLLRYLRCKGRSREDAEDLIQEAMVRLLVYAKDVEVDNEEAFLRRAVHRPVTRISISAGEWRAAFPNSIIQRPLVPLIFLNCLGLRPQMAPAMLAYQPCMRQRLPSHLRELNLR